MEGDKMNHQRIDKIFLYATMAIPFLILITVVFMLWPRTPLKIHTFEVYDDLGGGAKGYTIKAGENIEFEINFTKYIDANSEVTVLLKQKDNGYLMPLEEYKLTRMPVGTHHYKNSVLIPRATPNGKYVIIRNYRYSVSPLRVEDITIESNEFTVQCKSPDPLQLIKEGNEVSRMNTKKLDKLEKEMRKK
jgi:hypothetical protein